MIEKLKYKEILIRYMQRVYLKSFKNFFDNLLIREEISLKELSTKIDANYSTLKKWRARNQTIPENYFYKILNLYYNKEEKENLLKEVKFFSANWGASKGGKNWAKSLSKPKLKKRMYYTRSFIKRMLPKNIKISFNKDFCEFYGVLMGDGCLTKYKRYKRPKNYFCDIIISGNKINDINYHREYLIPLIKREFENINPYFYCYKNTNSIKIIIRNRPLFNSLKKLGFPIGKKKGKLILPPTILNQNWKNYKYAIRGLFDTDGCIFAKKNQGYKHIYITISSYTEKLLRQLMSLLKSRGYDCNISGTNLVIKGNNNIKRWMEDIGSSNQKHIIKYNYWVKNGVLPAYLDNGLVV